MSYDHEEARKLRRAGRTGFVQFTKRLELGLRHFSGWLLARLSLRRKRPAALQDLTSAHKRIIVIRQHNQFGDVLCTVPLLRALHARFAPDELAVVVSPQNMDALTGCRYVTNLICYDKLSFYRRPAGFFQFFRELRKGYDLLLVPSNVSISLTNDIMAFFAKAKVKIGPRTLESKSNRTSSVYDVALDLSWDTQPVHQSFRNMKVAFPLGIDAVDDSGELEYDVNDSVLHEVHVFLDRIRCHGARKVAVHAGAGKPGNRWKVENYAAVCEMLHDKCAVDLYLTEGPMDHDAIDKLVNLLKVPFVRIRDRAVPFVAALLKEMDMVLTNDTGIMHLAAAVGTPTLSLFGPTDPLQWAPLGRKHRFILGRGGDINTIDVDKVCTMAMKSLDSTAADIS